jgi:hypothetical protein
VITGKRKLLRSATACVACGQSGRPPNFFCTSGWSMVGRRGRLAASCAFSAKSTQASASSIRRVLSDEEYACWANRRRPLRCRGSRLPWSCALAVRRGCTIGRAAWFECRTLLEALPRAAGGRVGQWSCRHPCGASLWPPWLNGSWLSSFRGVTDKSGAAPRRPWLPLHATTKARLFMTGPI